MKSYFNNKVIWITGASSGIGEALAQYLLKNTTAQLVLSARNEVKLQSISEGSMKERVLILSFDLGSNFSAETLVNQIMQRLGRIDILINNGGLSQRSKVLEVSEDTERYLFEVNYFSYVKLSRAVLPIMLKQQSGHIVVMSSVAGKFGFYLRSSYSAAKHALHGYFETLRLEYEQEGISVTMVCPGKVKTNVSVNALTNNKQAHGKMDESHQNAMSAEKAAIQILRAVAHKKEEIYIGGKEILMVYFKRFCPCLFKWLIRKQSPY